MWTAVHEGAAARIGRVDTLGVAILLGPVDGAFFRQVGELMSELANEPRFSFMIVRASDARGPIQGEARDRALGLMREHGPKLLGFAYVLEGGGIKGKIMRTAMNTALLGARFDAKTFSDVREATRWMAARPGQPASVAEHADAIAELVAEHARP